MFEEILAENGTKFVVAAVVILLGLACLALVLWILRGRPSSPFIRGGRNRTPRLAVLDAAAIDTRRRLVLVRRDDVEHLVMIGGPSDIVIESRIVGASAETAKAEQAEPAPVRSAATAKAEETPAAARAATAERRPAATPEGVSAMGKVLYAADETPARATPARAATPQAETQQRTPERRAEATLDQARQRVLATPQATASATAQQPAASAAGGAAVVSDFEKLLEAEMANPSARAKPAQAATASRDATLTAAAQPAAKTREEAEAEMARLLGEIAANRKT